MIWRVETKRTTRAPWRDNGIRESNYAAAIQVWGAIAADAALIFAFRLVPITEESES